MTDRQIKNARILEAFGMIDEKYIGEVASSLKLDDFSEAPPQPAAPAQPKSGKLYLKLPTEDETLYPKVRAILNMFPGENPVVLFFADTGVRRGTRCQLAEPMLKELETLLGAGNVVLK